MTANTFNPCRLLQLLTVVLTVFRGDAFLDSAPSNGFQEVAARLQQVDAANCHSANVYLDSDTVSHVPRWPSRPSDVIPANRTSLCYAMTTSVGRAIFYSVIYNWTSSPNNFPNQPGFNYISMSTSASVHAAPKGVVASGLFYGINSSYANWVPDNAFNQTLPLLGIRADKHPYVGHDAGHENTPEAVKVSDLGSTPSTDYSNSQLYKQNEFYRKLQDTNSRGYQTQTTFTMRHHQDNSGSNYDERVFSVLDLAGTGGVSTITRPYFDCGQTNRWLVSFQSLPTELLPRYTWWVHLRRLKAVATSTVDVAFESIDINPCPLSAGNEAPNRFADTAVCPMTPSGVRRFECKVQSGKGFTNDGFECCGLQYCSVDSRITPVKYSLGKAEMDSADPTSCGRDTSPSSPLTLDETYYWLRYIKRDFEAQARTAVRLSHFLSDFLQNNEPLDDEEDSLYWDQLWSQWNFRDPVPVADSPMRYLTSDQYLTWQHIASEAFAALMADGTLMSVGVFFDHGIFPTGTTADADPVSAFAWKDRDVMDMNNPSQKHFYGNVADLFELGEVYTALDWFVRAKNQFNGNGASEFASHREARTTRTGENRETGASTVMAENGPITYKAFNFEDGSWITPYFRCDSRQAEWAVSYVIPIIAPSRASADGGINFAGVVKIDAFFTDQHMTQ